MRFFPGVDAGLESLRAVLGSELTDAGLPGIVSGLGDEDLVGVLRSTSTLIQALETVRIAAAGAVTARSGRERGQGGLAQVRGHRSPVSLVQEITGSTRGDAVRQVRLGEALHAGVPVSDADAGLTDVGGMVPVLWHAGLGAALLARTITSAQHDAILRGLGEPPSTGTGASASPSARDADIGADADADADADASVAADAVWRDAWAVAAEQLIVEAPTCTVEDLLRTARAVRDTLDPDGAARRFDDRFQARSFRMWVDEHGTRRGSISFDDEMAAWVQAITDSALRPRRGGPRFVDADEAARARQLEADPRTNDQLTYDLIMDTLRAGALADTEQVFGTRQAGIRVVITAAALHTIPGATDADASAAGVGRLEDTGTSIPAWLVRQRLCDTAQTTCVTDQRGNPLYLGREQRLFSGKQRLALAIRDGGCRWRGCDRPPSYCEAHHIDHYDQDEGRTDIDRGILLCRFHHMQLHNGGWHITRTRLDDFTLHPPGGPPVTLPPKLDLRYAWASVQPPPRRFRPAA
ncbi:DUF222 domain-containing protein [Microbacterium sp. DT81.1]|uniref:HNH endonuclease signature motif containing protein n=1 Tax=Microbacterium sp. DT81.1 TaxID=3393413 RepID=UPI003CE97F47